MSPRFLSIAFVLALAACSKGDSPPDKPKASAAAPAPIVASGEIDEGLKERLARQEAAARMFENKVLLPPPPRIPDPPPAAAKVPEPPPMAPKSSPAPQPAAPSRQDPPKAAAAPASDAATASPARTELASAAPVPAAPAAPRLLSRVDPDFPREAVQAGADSGNVRARMTLDASGAVTRVDIVEASPRRVFDRAVIRALSQWRYSAGAEGRTVEMEVAFRR